MKTLQRLVSEAVVAARKAARDCPVDDMVYISRIRFGPRPSLDPPYDPQFHLEVEVSARAEKALAYWDRASLAIDKLGENDEEREFIQGSRFWFYVDWDGQELEPVKT